MNEKKIQEKNLQMSEHDGNDQLLELEIHNNELYPALVFWKKIPSMLTLWTVFAKS